MKRILVANRGEIAVRIIRAARQLGIATVAVYSDADQGALHTRLADEAVALKGNFARDTYLNQEKLFDAATMTGCDAVHPGYGFFSENSEFAAAVERSGMTFIGPRSEIINLMGDKGRARAKAEELKVPTVPGTGTGWSVDKLKKFANDIGYPVLFKAAAGGSGRGMRVVRNADELEVKMHEAQSEAEAAFKDGSVFLEKYLERPRHIEVQIFGDAQGNVVHLGERECSLQRRHQKIVEEALPVRFSRKIRDAMREAAVRLGRAVGYTNSGTVEFLVENGERDDGKFYFVEMNTRIQVEHPVTEEVTGIDLVRLQLQVAAGERLPFEQKDIRFSGHAIEFRIYGENPQQGFSPANGDIRYISRAGGPGVREDGWAEAGSRLSPYYDSLISKIIVTGADRAEALERSRRFLSEYTVEGVETTLTFHRWVISQPEFLDGSPDVYWIGREYPQHADRRPASGPLRLPPTPIWKTN